MNGYRLTLVSNNYAVSVDVPTGSLIFDGESFVNPLNAKYILLSTTPSHGTFDAQSLVINASYRIAVASVSSIDPVVINPNSTEYTDPANGQCFVDINCNGTFVQYVTVHL